MSGGSEGTSEKTKVKVEVEVVEDPERKAELSRVVDEELSRVIELFSESIAEMCPELEEKAVNALKARSAREKSVMALVEECVEIVRKTEASRVAKLARRVKLLLRRLR